MQNKNGPPSDGSGQGPNHRQPWQDNNGQGQYYAQGQPPQGQNYGQGQYPQQDQQPPQGQYYGQGQQPPQGQYYGQGQSSAEAYTQPGGLAISSEASFFQSVYMWMFGGLITSAIIALMIYNSSFRFFMLQQRGMMIAVFIVQVGLVFLIGYLLKTATTNLIRALFFVYAGSMGITISLLLVIYPQNVIFKAFFTTAIVYGGLAVYGLVTKRSLERWGTFLFMALWGLLASIIINFFTKSVMFDYVISWVGVIVFAGLTAYDHQKLRVIHAGGFGSGEEEQKAIIMGAMELYIDFVALFIYIVRILGAGRD